jgi:uncharacterized protein YbjT (DUF2867 family)
MRIVILGATGMVGRGVLLEALDDPEVSAVLTVGRSRTGEAHAKLREIEHKDLFDLDPIREKMRGYDACIFCVGVSAIGLTEAEYSRLNYDIVIGVARAFLAVNPGSTFAYVSGQGTDSSERGRIMWARVKGRTENALLGMQFRAATMFRPGLIQPQRGIRSRTRLYRAFYDLTGPLTGMFVRMGVATTTTLLGLALLEAVQRPPRERVLDNAAISALGRQRLAHQKRMESATRG